MTVLGVYGEQGDEVGYGVAKAAAWSWWSVSKGAPDGGFDLCLEFKVEVLHDRGGIICSGGAVDVFFMDDGDPASLLVDVVPVCYFVTVECC